MLAACGTELRANQSVRKLKLLARHSPPQMPWESGKSRDAIWTCSCTCGETVVVEESKLVLGTVYSCKKCKNAKHGNEKNSEMIRSSGELAVGDTIGQLELVESLSETQWLVRCSCGNEFHYSKKQATNKRQKIKMCADCFGKRMSE